ncbi:MAG: hypothetical protein CM1200mP14_05810 [Gammaproteobacteria bacterium]|nr:MAG: hypothetical protein CM1200mP14_05810 [Gammaproteobacteria bacterium]
MPPDATLTDNTAGVVFGQAPPAVGGIPSVIMLSPGDDGNPTFDADPGDRSIWGSSFLRTFSS